MKIPLIKPMPPAPQEWIQHLKNSYEQHTFCNFGPAVKQLQKEMQNYLETEREPLTVCNATIALEIVLLAYELPKGSDVLLPTFTFAATAHSIERAGLNPVFVDADTNGWHMSLADAVERITPNTRAMVVVDTLGLTANRQAYAQFAQDHGNLALIMDAAASFGAVGWRHPYPIAQLFSMHITKTMGIGEGALIVSPNEEFRKRCQLVSNFGLNEEAQVEWPGTNGKMSDFQAAIGLASLQIVENRLIVRQSNAAIYGELFGGNSQVEPQCKRGMESFHAFPFYPIRYKGSMDKALKVLDSNGVGYKRYYQPLHQHPYFKKQSAHFPRSITFHVADTIGGEVICLPCYEGLSPSQLAMIASCFA